MMSVCLVASNLYPRSQSQQSLRSDDGRDLRQSATAEVLCSRREPTPLVVGETKSAAPKLFAQYPVLLTQIVDCLLLLLIHPTRDRDQHEPERIKNVHASRYHRCNSRERPCALFSARSSFWTFQDDGNWGARIGHVRDGYTAHGSPTRMAAPESVTPRRKARHER